MSDEKPVDKPENKPDPAKEMSDLKAANAALMAQLEKLQGKSDDSGADDDLKEKARKQRQVDDKKVNDTKMLEQALKFSLKSDEFLKANQSLLPKDVSDIFKAAESEKYDSAIEKDAAIKSGIVQSFFSVQANLDLLTQGPKSKLDEFLKLSKNGKQDKAQEIYDSVFEPAFEMLKREKKAKALNSNQGFETDADTAYKNRVMASAQKHYLGVKANA